MTAFHRFIARTLLISCALILQGCCPLTFFTLTVAGDGEKDVSKDFERGHVVGKVYELVQDAYLTYFSYSLWPSLHKYDILLGRRNSDCVFNIIIPKGSKFRVCSVVVSTNLGHELCSQRIFANLLDDNGKDLEKLGSCIKINAIKVNDMFKDTSQRPLENWIFHPCLDWIKEAEPLIAPEVVTTLDPMDTRKLCPSGPG